MGDALSSDLTVYVGPYLKCTPPNASNPYIEGLDDLLGESGVREYDAFGLNEPLNGADRQFVFQRHQDNPVTNIDSIVREMALFEVQFAHAIREIRGDYESVEVCWGIVPGWH